MPTKTFIPAVAAVLLAFSNYARANFEAINERVVTELMKTPIDDQEVEAILEEKGCGR